MNDQLKSIVRYALAFVGGVLVSQGWLDDAMWAELSGAVLTIISVGWSIWAKVGTARVPAQTLTSEQSKLTGVSPKV